ncbi:MAG: substrate-binding domain-containing protein [Paludibacter sp.]
MIYIDFSNNNSSPKYRQIIDVILGLLKEGKLVKGDKLPSCNELCKEYGLSQDTVYMAYNELKKLGLIISKVGKGYYIQNTNVDSQHKVFVLFDHLTAYKEELYEAFKLGLKGKGSEQIFFHNNNPKVFKTLIESALGEFSDFVIMPIADKEAMKTLDFLPQKKVIILDRTSTDLKKRFSYVCQEFERDIYQILNQNSMVCENYNRIILSIRHSKGHFREIISGFKAFCKKYSIVNEIIFDISTYQPKKNDAFIVVDDKDLVKIVIAIQNNNLNIGTDVGIISYNETALKQIVAGGITTISTDFQTMGRTAAEMIISGKKQKIHNPFLMFKRNSFF